MDAQREKLIAKNQNIVVALIMLGLIITVLFLRYEGEKLLDIATPRQQVTYYKISELKQEEHTALPQTITVYIEQYMGGIVQYSNSQCDYNEKDIKVYE